MVEKDTFFPVKAPEGFYTDDLDAKVAFFRKHLEAATPEDIEKNGHILWMVLFNEHFYLYPNGEENENT